ncbi:MAG TPA: methyl-accepting chemotaxis protein [Ktedonobacteraceae bacterium]|nr:methyl-accepting chemotaxis protein [Ktedonobacteraceae bacterium]HLI70480.1 methyl-accepting chemotaxis protein [Ktedonobacteraceae bacterium]
MSFLRKIPIVRRLFIALAIMAIVPSLLVVLLSTFYLSSLNARSQAVQTSIDAQSTAANGLDNLQRMNSQLQTRFNQIFASLSPEGVTDPSLSNSGGLIGADIAARELDFSQTLTTFQSTYEVATAPNMNSIRSILLSDSPQTAQGIISDQQQAVDAVAGSNGLWTQYQRLQDQEVQILNRLDPSVPGHPAVLPQPELNADYVQAYTVLWQTNNVFLNLKNAWQRVVNDSTAVGKTVTSVGPSLTQPLLVATVLVIFFGFGLVALTGWAVNVTISSPLRNLAGLTERISRGHTEVRASADGRDEISVVATAMNNMLDNIVHLIQQAQSQRDLLQAQVEKLVSEVCNVGEGDLRIQAEVTSDALGVLADSFNYMVEELSGLIIRVQVVAREVEKSTTLTSDRMTELVETADRQIQQITNAAFEIERMALASQQVASRATALASSARQARSNAQGGRLALQQTIEGMERIYHNVQETSEKVQTLGERSREINNIVEAISSIAHQTNRLALDAAIQAAMAGENGKGFGAVATDIRRQAERAKEQANSVGRIVRSVRDDIEAVAVAMRDTERESASGTKLAEEAGTSLESIFSVIDQQAREIEIINRMTMQQQHSSGQVVQIMQSVSESTQQSSVSTREAAQNMDRLTRLAEQLLSSVEAFKLPDDRDSQASAHTALIPQNQGNFRTITASSQPAGTASGSYSIPLITPPTSPYPPLTPPGYPPLAPGNQNGFNSSFPSPNSNEGNGHTGPRSTPHSFRPLQPWQETNHDQQQ